MQWGAPYLLSLPVWFSKALGTVKIFLQNAAQTALLPTAAIFLQSSLAVLAEQGREEKEAETCNIFFS